MIWKGPVCLDSSCRGRIGLGELFRPTSSTAEALESRSTSTQITHTLEVVVSAQQALLELIASGRVSLDEWKTMNSLGSLNLGFQS
jgi:type II secretory ATPase GspE/PulE/Tfp pilus assembly ATPase PilB-like protein